MKSVGRQAITHACEWCSWSCYSKLEYPPEMWMAPSISSPDFFFLKKLRQEAFSFACLFLAPATIAFITLMMLLPTFFRLPMWIEDNRFFINSLRIHHQVLTAEVPSPVQLIIPSSQPLQCDNHFGLPRKYAVHQTNKFSFNMYLFYYFSFREPLLL